MEKIIYSKVVPGPVWAVGRGRGFALSKDQSARRSDGWNGSLPLQWEASPERLGSVGLIPLADPSPPYKGGPNQGGGTKGTDLPPHSSPANPVPSPPYTIICHNGGNQKFVGLIGATKSAACQDKIIQLFYGSIRTLALYVFVLAIKFLLTHVWYKCWSIFNTLKCQRDSLEKS